MPQSVPQHPLPLLAQSDFVKLRRMHPKDAAVFQNYRRDPGVVRFQSWPKMTISEINEFLEHMSVLETVLRPGRWTQVAVAHPTTDALIGDMGWCLSKDETEVELGITIDPRQQRKGYAKHAFRLAIDYVFANSNIHQVICGADPRNTASLGLIAQLGFNWTHQDPSPIDLGIMDEMFALTRAAAQMS